MRAGVRASSPQKKRQRPVFIRSVGFQPATMLPKAAAKMAALPVNKKQAVAVIPEKSPQTALAPRRHLMRAECGLPARKRKGSGQSS